MASSGAGQPGMQLAGASSGAMQLMPPPPPRPPKRKEVVLEEDEWTANLEAIIERDFFPELGKLQSKIAWLQAIRSGDPEQIRQAQLLIAQRRAAAAAGGRPHTGTTPAGAPLFTPGGTAARVLAGDTPYIPGLPAGVPLRGGSVRPGTGARPATGQTEVGGGDEDEEAPAVPVAPPVSLDTFLAVHTSEDNASFQEILENVNKRRRLKAAAQLAPRPDPKLMITDGREQTDGFGSTGQDPATLIGWKYEPKNALYYDGASRDVVPFSDAELAAQVQGPPKAINHGATRFPRELAPSASATPSASGMSGSAAGSRGSGGDGALPAAAAAGRPAAAAGVAGTRGYDILATPSFDPGAGGETPIMTWGDIEATPLRIEAEDLPPGPLVEGPSFFIKESTQREQKGQALSSRAAIALRNRRGGPRGGTPLLTGTLAAAAAARRQATATGRPGTLLGAGARPGSSARPPTGQKGARPMSEAARRLATSLHKGRQLGADDLGLRASYRGNTPKRAAAATPASSSGAWSAAATPGGHTGRRISAGAGGATPSVHATLEEEELRVQALMKARQAEAERSRQLDTARVAAKQALDAAQQQKQGQLPPPQQQQVGAGASGADLTAGLLNI